MSPTDIIELSCEQVSAYGSWSPHILLCAIGVIFFGVATIMALIEFRGFNNCDDGGIIFTIIVFLLTVLFAVLLSYGLRQGSKIKLNKCTIQIGAEVPYIEVIDKYEILDAGMKTGDGSIVHKAYRRDSQ